VAELKDKDAATRMRDVLGKLLPQVQRLDSEIMVVRQLGELWAWRSIPRINCCSRQLPRHQKMRGQPILKTGS